MSESPTDRLNEIVSRYAYGSQGKLDIEVFLEELRDLSGAAYLVFNEVTHNEESTTTRVISGMKENLEKAAEFLGFRLDGASYRLDPEILSVFDKKGLVEFPSICALSASQIPRGLCERLCGLFGIGRVYAIGLKDETRLMGDLIFIMKKKTELRSPREIEILASFFQLLLQKEAAAENSVLSLLAAPDSDREKKATMMQALYQATDRIPDVVYQLDSEGKFVFVNQAIQRYGYMREDLIGCSILDIVHPEDREKAYWPLRERRTGERKTRNFEVRLITGKRRTAFFKVNEMVGPDLPVLMVQAEGLYRSGIEEESFCGTLGIGHDVTEEKQLNLELDRQSQIFRIMAENVGDAVWLEQAEPYKVYYLNPAAEKMFFSTWNGTDRDPLEWIKKVHPEDRKKVIDFLDTNRPAERSSELEYRLVDEDDTVRWINSRLFPVYQDGKLTKKFVGIATDTTRRRLEQARLENMVELEKVHMREMNHRVKNNLAMIDSLLNLELNQLPDEMDGTKSILRKVQGRIQAVGQVHEMLIGVSDRGMVDSSVYLQSLAESLCATDSRTGDEISLSFSMDEKILLPVGSIIPLGMIMNELIINALKYAFPDGRRGEIRILFQRIPEKHLLLSVGDDGIPLPSDREKKITGRIGMNLINALVRQLEGEFSIEKEEGFKTFAMRFSEPHGVG